MVGHLDDPMLAVPLSIINLKFKKLRFNVERQSFRQLLKVKTFFAVSSFTTYLTELTDVMGNLAPSMEDEPQVLDLNRVKYQESRQIVNKTAELVADNSVSSETVVKPLSSMRVNLIIQGLEVRA